MGDSVADEEGAGGMTAAPRYAIYSAREAYDPRVLRREVRGCTPRFLRTDDHSQSDSGRPSLRDN